MREISAKGVYSRADIYDILFGWDRSPEFLFVDSIFQLNGVHPGEKVLELACGTGTCSFNLESLGWQMEGLDLSISMVQAYNERAKEMGRTMVAHQGDMTNFQLDSVFSAAYCPLGSIGLLGEDDRVVAHLKATGEAVKAGGLYLIDLGLNPRGTAPLDLAQVDWLMEGEHLVVHATQGKVRVENNKGQLLEELEWEGVPLEFESSHFLKLIEESGDWELLSIYPESEKSEDGISLFDPSTEGLEGNEDRAMVLLKRKEST